MGDALMVEREDGGASEHTQKTSKHLFKLCMKGEWEEVVRTFEKDKKAHTAKITKTGDTALHVAVTDDQYDIVEKLVKLICSETEEGKRKEALGIQNKRKNTALHFAASMGSVEMCEYIASAEASLLSMRNVDGETPLFLAALHGRKEVFLFLHYFSNNNHPEPLDYYSNCRRTDGDTILHAAIAGDYFELAFQIIHLYGDLVNSVNHSGLTPLHLLANKPSVFRSGGHLGRFERIVYNVTEPLRQFHKKLLHNDQIGPKRDLEALKNIGTDDGAETKSAGSESTTLPHSLFPLNYESCVDLFKFVFMMLSVIFGTGSANINKIRRKKEKHEWSVQIMDELLKRASMYEYDDDGSIPVNILQNKDQRTHPYTFYKGGNVTWADNTEVEQHLTIKGEPKQQNNGEEKVKVKEKKTCETPILIAAKNGVTEMVEKIMESFPVAVHDMDANKKNIVLLAVENRQTYLYDLLLKKKSMKESIFDKVDNEGNSALHLAAKLGEYKPWLIPGEALQMHWEIKWYLFVKESMRPHFFSRYNDKNKTPRDIFSETHRDLLKSGGEWLKKTSESCSLVAALIATVAFSTSTTVPGDFKDDTGSPTLENRPEFKAFAIASLIALCCSVTSLVMFLSILTSRYQERDFGKNLPRKLIVGLTSLFMSITSMMVCFCAGHFFILKDKLKSVAFPVYAVTCLPVTLFALAQFPLYIDLIWATFKKVPQRGYKTSLH
ncbi:hypothetical protein V8G54_033080 [Vigna mungo]|uniref:PGG domain-containing protein n=1 Tax=Vigna mungo TaxID=3915 RepID=A0AAQ3MMP4_VIGMU